MRSGQGALNAPESKPSRKLTYLNRRGSITKNVDFGGMKSEQEKGSSLDEKRILQGFFEQRTGQLGSKSTSGLMVEVRSAEKVWVYTSHCVQTIRH